MKSRQNGIELVTRPGTCQQVSQLMSLLYYGEVWLTMDNFSTSFSSMLSDLKIAAELTFMKSPKGGGSGLVDGIKAEAPIEEDEDIAEVDEAVETSLKAESAEVPSEDFTQPRFNTNDGDIQHRCAQKPGFFLKIRIAQKMLGFFMAKPQQTASDCSRMNFKTQLIFSFFAK